MKVLLRWDDEHLRLATANLNSNNPYLENPLSVKDMENLIISNFSSPETFDGLSISIYGVMFTPELVPYQDIEQDEHIDLKEEYLTMFLHISVPVMYNLTDDIKEVMLFEVKDWDDEIIIN